MKRGWKRKGGGLVPSHGLPHGTTAKLNTFTLVPIVSMTPSQTASYSTQAVTLNLPSRAVTSKVSDTVVCRPTPTVPSAINVATTTPVSVLTSQVTRKVTI